jgi:hypothetical protein
VITSPLDEARRVGTVTMAGPQVVTLNLPHAGSDTAHLHHGEIVPRGEVGEFVCFPRTGTIVLGRITRVELPERDRLSIEPRIGRSLPTDPVGHVALLTDIDLASEQVTGAVSSPPKIGTPAYSVPRQFLQWVLAASSNLPGEGAAVSLDIGDVAGVMQAPVSVSPERLFGRHCAVLGVTGGGKSWTIARLVEECAKHDCKVLLIDATGEFATLDNVARHVSIGSERDAPTSTSDVCCPYTKLEERDLFAFFTPSGQSQAPVLREAIRSLKLVEQLAAADPLVQNGCIPKAMRQKAPIMAACRTHVATLESPLADFEIERLAEQVEHECVHPTAGTAAQPDATRWGQSNQAALGWCLPMMLRIDGMVRATAMRPVFRPLALPAIQDELDNFIASPTVRVLRVSLRYLSFALSVRPIVVNAIGRHLLLMARDKKFVAKPLVVLLDEGHQFLGKTIGDEGNQYPLDAFDLIAKEGRKYGLTLCLATQRPRDIQDGVLSQMGTMIVHRLTHGADREVVERAARDVEKSVAAFLPTLAPGQALLLGADFPVPIPIQVRGPEHRPDAKGPDYQRHWAAAQATT